MTASSGRDGNGSNCIFTQEFAPRWNFAFTEKYKQKPRIRCRNCVQVHSLIYCMLRCMNMNESHFCVRVYLVLHLCVCAPEEPHTLTAAVTPSSAVLCPFCQESRHEKRSVCVTLHVSCVCMCKEGRHRKRRRCKRIFARLCGWQQSLVSSYMLLRWQS